MRGHPHHLARGNELGDVSIEDVGDSVPNPGKRPVVVGGARGASFGSSEQRLTVGADGGDEGALGEDFEQSPGFRSGGGIAPRGGPAKAVGDKVTLAGHRSNPKPRASNGRPLAIDERAITVPSEVLRPRFKVRRRDQPGEGAVGLPRRHGDPNGKEPMKLEVPESMVRDVVSDQAGSGRGERPAPRREGGGATEPVLKSANSTEAKLAPVVINGEGSNGSLSRLRPLPATDRRGKVASALVGPAAFVQEFLEKLAYEIDQKT